MQRYEHRVAMNLPLLLLFSVILGAESFAPVYLHESAPERSSFDPGQDSFESSETIVANQYESPSNEHEESEEDPEGPPDHVIPYSEHQEAKDIPTRRYNPGDWAKGKRKEEEQDVEDFVPTKLYAQVRGTHTVKRVPRKEAIASAETEEEKENAPRLREVVTDSKVNTVYTEEGYEDSAYDHAGQVRDADYHEGYARRLHELADVKQGSGLEKAKGGEGFKKVDPDDYKEYEDDYSDHHEETPAGNGIERKDDHLSAVANPRLVAQNGIAELEEDLAKEIEEIEGNVELNKLENLDDASNQAKLATERANSPENPTTESYTQTAWNLFKARQATTQSPIHERGTTLQLAEIFTPAPFTTNPQKLVSESPNYVQSINDLATVATTEPSSSEEDANHRSWQRTVTTEIPKVVSKPTEQPVSRDEYNATKQKHPYRVLVRHKPEDFAAKTFKHGDSKKDGGSSSGKVDPSENYAKVLDYIRNEDSSRTYNNPLHNNFASNFATNNFDGFPSRVSSNLIENRLTNSRDLYGFREEDDLRRMRPPPPQPSFFEFSSANIGEPGEEPRWQNSQASFARSFDPFKSQANFAPERSSYPATRLLPPAPSSRDEFARYLDLGFHSTRIRRRRSIQSKSKADKTHEALLDESPRITEGVIEKEIDERFNEGVEKGGKTEREKVEVELPEFDYVDELNEEEEESGLTTTEASLDLAKYPFYNNTNVPSMSALKYATDPRIIPRKTSGGMEFYDSRDKYKRCQEVDPSLDEALPDEEEPVPERGLKEDLPRLRGLGAKLDCYKAKYFDERPFDNPLFQEGEIGEPSRPLELNASGFSERLMTLPEENEGYAVPRMSKRPESRSSQPAKARQSIRLDHGRVPERGRNANLHTIRTASGNTVRNPRVQRAGRAKGSLRYQDEVYRDVMGNIRQLAQAQKESQAAVKSKKRTNPPGRQNDTSIEGLLPPNDRTPKGRRAIRRSPSGSRLVKVYKKVRVQRRSVEESGEKYLEDLANTSRSSNVSDTVTEGVSRRAPAGRRRTDAARDARVNETTGAESEQSPRVVYTIRDRIRHSKPKEEQTNVGKFTANETATNEDRRRNEPRYSSIKRKRVQLTTTEQPDPNLTSSNETLKPENATTARSNDTFHPKNESGSSGLDKPEAGYAVCEDVQEDVPTTTNGPSAEIEKLKAYLNSEPAGYSKAFSSKDESSEDEGPAGSFERKSSDNEEESENEKFPRFDSRPSSPAESFEDERFSGLGPRVNKPDFHHPPFSVYKDLTDDKDESKSQEERKFPWYRRKEDQEEGPGPYRKSISRFEFPWEKRRRIERERTEAGKSGEAKPAEDVSASSSSQRNFYPWDRYGSGRRYAWDSVESDSVHRPVMKFSSRYSLRPPNGLERISASIRKTLDEEDSREEQLVPSNSTGNRVQRIHVGTLIPENVTPPPRKKQERRRNSNAIVSEVAKPITREEDRPEKARKPSLESVQPSTGEVAKKSGSEAAGKNGRRRRKPARNSTATIETTTEAAVEVVNRTRRRQRPQSVVLATTSTTSTTTTARPRRRQQKLGDEPSRTVTEVPSQAQVRSRARTGSNGRSRRLNENVPIEARRRPEEPRSSRLERQRKRNEKTGEQFDKKPSGEEDPRSLESESGVLVGLELEKNQRKLNRLEGSNETESESDNANHEDNSEEDEDGLARPETYPWEDVRGAEDVKSEEDPGIKEETTHRFVKDPGQRLYYYAEARK